MKITGDYRPASSKRPIWGGQNRGINNRQDIRYDPGECPGNVKETQTKKTNTIGKKIRIGIGKKKQGKRGKRKITKRKIGKTS